MRYTRLRLRMRKTLHLEMTEQNDVIYLLQLALFSSDLQSSVKSKNYTVWVYCSRSTLNISIPALNSMRTNLLFASVRKMKTILNSNNEDDEVSTTSFRAFSESCPTLHLLLASFRLKPFASADKHRHKSMSHRQCAPTSANHNSKSTKKSTTRWLVNFTSRKISL